MYFEYVNLSTLAKEFSLIIKAACMYDKEIHV